MNFEAIVARARSLRPGPDGAGRMRVCVSAIGESTIAPAVLAVFNGWAEKKGMKEKIVAVGSFGYYDLEPIVIIEKSGQPTVLYRNVNEETASLLIRDCLEGNNLRADIALCTTSEQGVEGIPRAKDLPLFSLQYRIALRNCGLTDPEDINEYVAGHDGYAALAKVLRMSPVDVVEEVRKSRLRGRGGAGYVTADKWTVVRESEGDAKYVICNGVDGDPSAQTARLLLEGDPHAVLEGLLIAAYAVGASRCIVAVATGNGTALARLGKALAQMREYGLLGEKILDSTFSCDIEVREVTRSLVAGEETALLRSLEGKQPMPSLRESNEVASEFEGTPTLINNIETLVNVSAIIRRGAEWFDRLGTKTSAGSKVVTLSGSVVHGFTVEVPFGTELGTIVREIGGGADDGSPIKAVQFGGPTGAYFSISELSIPIDYEAIRASGSVIGWGTIEVIPGGTCAVEMTERLVSYLQSESCGKCVFCREGTFQMSDILKDIAEDEGKALDLDLLAELGAQMQVGSICGFGRSAPNPVLSSIRLFRHEYDIHIKEKKCPWK